MFLCAMKVYYWSCLSVGEKYPDILDSNCMLNCFLLHLYCETNLVIFCYSRNYRTIKELTDIPDRRDDHLIFSIHLLYYLWHIKSPPIGSDGVSSFVFSVS
jgi:hypothetical protein